MMAVKEDMREVVSLLVNAGASLDLQNNVRMVFEMHFHYIISQWGDSALMVAVREDRTDIISTLIESGAALDLQNKVNLVICYLLLEHISTRYPVGTDCIDNGCCIW